jgi:hypothetical protein
MKYIVEFKENGEVVSSKEFNSVKHITEALNCTSSAVTKNFKCRYNPDEKPSKKISQKIFDAKYNILAK